MSFPISADEFDRAYSEMEIVPVSGCWAHYYSDGDYDARRCGCPLSAIVAFRRQSFDEATAIHDLDSEVEGFDDVSYVANIIGLTKDQVLAFIRGFDHGESWRDDESFDRESFYAGVTLRSRYKPIDYEEIVNRRNGRVGP